MDSKGHITVTIVTLNLLLFCFHILLAQAQPQPQPQPQRAAASIIRSESLRVGFYGSTCPEAEYIVRQTVANYFLFNPAVAAGLIRLYFHDCFVRGCDASILLDETPTGEMVEKDSPANGKTLQGLDTIDDAKQQIELRCPGTVSCADILAFAARDAAVLAGLPYYRVPSGRRDGTISLAYDTLTNLPSPAATISILTTMFAHKGFNQTEMVILSGAHSIGGSHCSSFYYRIYNVSMDPIFADALKLVCPKPATQRKVQFDPASPFQLDGSYYRTLEMGRGLLATDQALMTNKLTRAVVRQMANRPMLWAKEFTRAMVKLGALDVLVGNEGEVRRSCRFVN